MKPPALRPGRRIDGISAVLMPFAADDQPDWPTFVRLIERTWSSGLTPAVNMDTGYVHLLTRDERLRVLEIAGDAARGRRFVAGAYINDVDGDPLVNYARQLDQIRHYGGTPILFQAAALAASDERAVLEAYRSVADAGGPLLGFELGSMFAPFGRIYSPDFFRHLLDIEAFVGLKHSSLDRIDEWTRLEIRDRQRPDFALYTGNDLAIDMVFYGSDYLLGLSAFAVEAFAARDRLWHACDARAFGLNDLLQYLGNFAFRAPVPAYKHSAAQFLALSGLVPLDRPHPRSPRRPDSDVDVLRDIRDRLNAMLGTLT